MESVYENAREIAQKLVDAHYPVTKENFFERETLKLMIISNLMEFHHEGWKERNAEITKMMFER